MRSRGGRYAHRGSGTSARSERCCERLPRSAGMCALKASMPKARGWRCTSPAILARGTDRGSSPGLLCRGEGHLPLPGPSRWQTQNPTSSDLSRLLSHVPPCGRHRIRYYGLYRPGAVPQRQVARAQLGGKRETKAIVADPRPSEPRCPRCGARLQRTHWRWSKISLLKGAERYYVQPAVGPDTRPGLYPTLGNTGPPAYIFLHQRVPVN